MRSVEQQEKDDAGGDASIGYIEHKESRDTDAEQVDVKEVHIEEIDHATVEEGSFAKQYAIEHSIDEVTDRPSKDKGECDTHSERTGAMMIEIPENGHACYNGEEREKQTAAQIDAECHPRILDVRKAEEIPENLPARPVWHSFPGDTQRRQMNPFDQEF